MQMRTRTDDFPQHAAGKEAVSDAEDRPSEQPDLGSIQKLQSLVNGVIQVFRWRRSATGLDQHQVL